MTSASQKTALNVDVLQREILRSTRRMQTFLHDTLTPVCQAHGITMQQFYLLVELSIEPGQSISQLSERTGILRTNFALVCRKTETQHLIERRRNEQDHRSFILFITNEGQAKLAAIRADVYHTFQDAIEQEQPETLDTIARGLEALVAFSDRMKARG